MPDDVVDRIVLDDLASKLGRDALGRIVAAQVAYGRTIEGQLDAMIGAPVPDTLRRLSHQMAGSSASVGLTALGQAALRLETTLLRDTPCDLGAEIVMLRDLVRRSIEALVRLFPENAVER